MLTIEEFVAACRRVSTVLERRTENAKKKSDKFEGSNVIATTRFLQAAQDFYAFTRLIEFCAALKTENAMLRQFVEETDENIEDIVPLKKGFLN